MNQGLVTSALRGHSETAAILLKAMANARRLEILCHLAETEMSVSALEAQVNLSQSALSQHLARLRRDRLVKTKRNAQSIIYSIANSDVLILLSQLQQLYADENRTLPSSKAASASRSRNA